MGLDLEYTEGQTPLGNDDKEGLLIKTISTRNELNEFEQQNIEEAMQWLSGKQFNRDTILTEDFIRNLHKRMYGNVWKWAGTFRRTELSIGVDPVQINVRLRTLLDDVKYWIENKTYSDDEIAIRFKHRLVSIHCFPNGNGRHSRIMADIIAEKIFQKQQFTWGSGNPENNSLVRTAYLKAIKLADAGNIYSLIEFARS